MNQQLAIITVIYNNYSVSNDFLNSLRKQTDKNFRLFITDLSDRKEKINVESIPTTILSFENRGYAFGVNQALKQALKDGFTQFCIVNNDTFFEPNFTQLAIESLDKNPHSMIGGRIYYASGYEYHQKRYRQSDKGNVLWFAGGIIDWDHMITKHRGVDEVDKGQYDKFEETEFITGCLILFDKEVLDKVGFWDESLFLYYEDADFCIRATKKGIKLYYDPTLVIWHKVAQSTGGSGSLTHQKYQSRNRLKIGLRYAPWRTKLHLLKNAIF